LTATVNKIPAGRVYRKEGLSVPHDVPLEVPSKVRYGGVSMVGIYRHPEILDTDPYGNDKVIYSVHPFLPLWQKKPYGN
jgi:hypothetical protein